MVKPENTTSVLSISSPKMDCSKVIQLLRQNKILSSVIENTSVRCGGNKSLTNWCWLENGCQITTSLKPKFIKSDLWEPLQKQFGLGCAHLLIPGKYCGCIDDYQE